MSHSLRSHFLSKTWSSKHIRALYITASRPAWGLGLMLAAMGMALGGGGVIGIIARWRIWSVLGRLALPILFVFPVVAMASAYDEAQYIRMTPLLQSQRWAGSFLPSMIFAWGVYALVEVPAAGLWSFLAAALGCGGWVGGAADAGMHQGGRGAEAAGHDQGRVRVGHSSSRESHSDGSKRGSGEHGSGDEHRSLRWASDAASVLLGGIRSSSVDLGTEALRPGYTPLVSAEQDGNGGAQPIGIAGSGESRRRTVAVGSSSGSGPQGGMLTRPRGGAPQSHRIAASGRSSPGGGGYGSGSGTELAPTGPRSGADYDQGPNRRESAGASMQHDAGALHAGADDTAHLSTSAPQPSHAALQSQGTQSQGTGSPGPGDVAWRAARRWRRDRLAALAHVAHRNDSFGVVDEEDDEEEDEAGTDPGGIRGRRAGSGSHLRQHRSQESIGSTRSSGGQQSQSQSLSQQRQAEELDGVGAGAVGAAPTSGDASLSRSDQGSDQ